MAKSIKLTIRTPEKEVFNGEVQYVKLITDGGVTKILPGHADMIASARYSPLIFETLDRLEEDFVIRQSLININNSTKSVEIMAIDCVLKSEMRHQDAEEYLKFIEEELKKGKDLSEFKIKYLEEERFAVFHQIKSNKK